MMAPFAIESGALCHRLLFSFNDPASTEIYTLSLHDALPICWLRPDRSTREGEALEGLAAHLGREAGRFRSEEHTSELQSQFHLVCRLLLEKKKNREEVQSVF